MARRKRRAYPHGSVRSLPLGPELVAEGQRRQTAQSGSALRVAFLFEFSVVPRLQPHKGMRARCLLGEFKNKQQRGFIGIYKHALGKHRSLRALTQWQGNGKALLDN